MYKLLNIIEISGYNWVGMRCLSMNRTIILVAALMAFGCASFASLPVANVSSAQGFYLDGHAVAAAGVSSWPLVSGDDLTTTAAAATMFFPDGSRVKLAPQSRVKITGTAEQPKVILLAGNLNYRLAPGSLLLLTNAGQPANNSGGQGPAAAEVRSQKFYFIEGFLVAAGLAAAAVLMCWGVGCFSGAPPASPR